MTTYEEKEKALNRYRISKIRTKEARIKLEELKLDMRYPKAIEYSDMPKGSVPDKDLSDYMVKLQEAELELKSRIRQEEEMWTSTNALIDTLDEPQQRYLLKLRYLKLCSWPYICGALNYSKSQVNRIKKKAINNLFQKK